MGDVLTWGILGTGKIAGIFADGLTRSKRGKLIAVASRTQEAADRFGNYWNVSRRYDAYERLLTDEDVQIVYIATPNTQHALWAIKAAEAGKHILCEKPLGISSAEASAIVGAAKRHNVFLAEAFMYRFHPQTAKLVELLRTGIIGETWVIEAAFSVASDHNPEGRLLKNALGGGGIMDVGCYCTSFARLIAGTALGKAVAEPTKVTGMGYIGNTNVDEYAVASLAFPGNMIAQLFCGIKINALITQANSGFSFDFADDMQPWSTLSRDGLLYVVTAGGLQSLLIGSLNGGPTKTIPMPKDAIEITAVGWTQF